MPGRKAALALGVALCLARGAGAQLERSVVRGIELEQASRYAEAAQAYREGLSSPNFAAALLGLERVLAQMGQSATLVPVLDSVIAARPRDPLPRTVQLRTLRSLGRGAETRAAFEQWVADLPRDPMPYREYARLLLQEGQPMAADSIIQRAQRAFGGGRDMAMEMAQLRSAMGLWVPAAEQWRAALATAPYLAQAAAFSLQPTPPAQRDSVRAALAGGSADAPPVLAVRRALSILSLSWGAPRDAWAALSGLPPSDSAATAWRDFAEQAEGAEAWSQAHAAMAASARWRPSSELWMRAATDALAGDDAAAALGALDEAARGSDSAVVAHGVLPLRVRALTRLGRAAEADSAAHAYRGFLDAEAFGRLMHDVAWGWVRRGDLGRARAALGEAGPAAENDPVVGWIALYEGDLAMARRLLRDVGGSGATPELVSAMAMLSRTRSDTGKVVGAAFLALARGDSVTAAARLVDGAAAMPDLAPLLLAMAARVQAARHAETPAVALWQRIATEFASTPEAPEAELEWARVLHRRGDSGGATQHLEHLILTWPQSALVPQARRELDLLRSGTA